MAIWAECQNEAALAASLHCCSVACQQQCPPPPWRLGLHPPSLPVRRAQCTPLAAAATHPSKLCVLTWLKPSLVVSRFYGEPIPGRVLCERLASYMHLFNLYWSMRSAPVLVIVQPGPLIGSLSGRSSRCSPKPCTCCPCACSPVLPLQLARPSTCIKYPCSFNSSLAPCPHACLPRRPYGAAGLLATYDDEGPALYLVEPSGAAHKYHGTAVGAWSASRLYGLSKHQCVSVLFSGMLRTQACTHLQYHVTWCAAARVYLSPFESCSCVSHVTATGPAFGGGLRVMHRETTILVHSPCVTVHLQVGKARQAVKNELEKMKLGQITCREAVVEAAKM